MYGSDGKIKGNKMTWQEFQTWQRWNEFPERMDNPPLICSICFWYKGKTYYIDRQDGKMQLFDDSWNHIASCENLLTLCNMPIIEWENRSFKDIIEDVRIDA